MTPVTPLAGFLVGVVILVLGAERLVGGTWEGVSPVKCIPVQTAVLVATSFSRYADWTVKVAYLLGLVVLFLNLSARDYASAHTHTQEAAVS